MKLWRVILSIHLKSTGAVMRPHPKGVPSTVMVRGEGKTWESYQGYSYTIHPAVFYVHAVSASDAQTMAIKLVSAGVSPHDEYRTSGSVIAVDGNLNPVLPERDRVAPRCMCPWDSCGQNPCLSKDESKENAR